MSKNFVAGFCLGISLMACCGATFPYHYYGIDLKDQKLLGPTTQGDLPLTDCAASAANESPCIGMMSDAFLSLKQDYLNIQNELNNCQHQLAAK